jgi:hypothetical protein
MPANTDQSALAESELFIQLGTTATRLSSETAARGLAEVDPNTVAAGQRHTVLRDLLHRCRNPLVIQLFISSAAIPFALLSSAPLTHTVSPLFTGDTDTVPKGKFHRGAGVECYQAALLRRWSLPFKPANRLTIRGKQSHAQEL